MPSTGRVQLNLSVEPEIKESLRKHCEAAGVSFAQAITEYVKACDLQGELIIGAIARSSPNLHLDNFVTQEQLNDLLEQFTSTNALDSPSINTDNLVNKDELEDKLKLLKSELNSNCNSSSPIPSDIDEQINSAIAKLESGLRTELQPILDAHKKTKELLRKVTSLVTGIDTQHEDIPTITKVDKKSLEPIFEPPEGKEDDSVVEIRQQDSLEVSDLPTITENKSFENKLEQTKSVSDEELPAQTDQTSLEDIFFEDEDSEEVDYQNCTVPQLRKIVTVKGLGKKFREKLDKPPRNARKAEIIKFLKETSILGLD